MLFFPKSIIFIHARKGNKKTIRFSSWHQWHRSKREYTDLFDDANDVDDVNDAPLGKLHTYRQDMALKLMPESLPFGI